MDYALTLLGEIDVGHSRNEVVRRRLGHKRFSTLYPPFIQQHIVPGAHHLERATSMRSCHRGVTDQFIFRTVLARVSS